MKFFALVVLGIVFSMIFGWKAIGAYVICVVLLKLANKAHPSENREIIIQSIKNDADEQLYRFGKEVFGRKDNTAIH